MRHNTARHWRWILRRLQSWLETFCMIAVVPLIGVLYGRERRAGNDQRIDFLAMVSLVHRRDSP